ncbi:hypothetical protein EYF80_065511 [Liparis tanakae]|uniref:Uncharacterized protein n=1 Tax=Liparis tanakae TaxID=230148 RepID=A0A4Z2E712_9TELE|nr:hypothetical protein EYF80_065511 [Liparis tanakae]
MRMYRGSAAVGSFRLQKPYITLALSKVSVMAARPPPAAQNKRPHHSISAANASVTLSSTGRKPLSIHTHWESIHT